MNLYHKKQRWKIVLLILAILLVAISLWFSNTIVKKVAQREIDRVEQWADAVKRKADLVNLTNNAFEELRQNERKKVELWTTAMVEGNKDLTDYTLVLAILQENGGNVPIIITDQKGEIERTHNLTFLDSMIIESIPVNVNRDSFLLKSRSDSLAKFIKEWPKTHAPIQIDLYAGKQQNVYYYDSKKLMDLELRKDSLFNAFNEELLANEYLVPVIFINRDTRDIIGTNMNGLSNNPEGLAPKIKELGNSNDSILVDLGSQNKGVIYFEHSPELKQLKYFPIVQFIIIGLFIFIGYIIFSTFRKAEQDQVWAGMAKETAHQLGTPISSLMAWIQLLQADGVNMSTITEMNKDIDRLNTITNRFSKIGSKAVLKTENIVPIIEHTIVYLKRRISTQIELTFEASESIIMAETNVSLLEWVIENITKNAVDAMEGKGKIKVFAHHLEDEVFIDIIDDGKGIPQAKLKTVFQPGYTTKTRGWGLGLSLVKRIVEEFHKGKTFVLKSEVNVGTTFRIVLKSK